MHNIIRQRQWTDDELFAAGFRPYVRKKQVVMARILPQQEIPRAIPSEYETLVADENYMVLYQTGDTIGQRYEDYHRWPVRRDIFQAEYRIWDEPGWRPDSPQLHLMSLGCLPYYKIASVWAKELDVPTQVQSLESPEPTTIPAEAWLCIGTHGEPYAMTADNFHSRYYGDVPQEDLA
jgi:hypothetical protein